MFDDTQEIEKKTGIGMKIEKDRRFLKTGKGDRKEGKGGRTRRMKKGDTARGDR